MALAGDTVARLAVALTSPAAAADVNTNFSAASTGPTTVTAADANAFDVGPSGATSPTLQVDTSTASAATGLKIKSAASGSGVAVTAIGGTNETLKVDAKGSGAVKLATAQGTGGVQLCGAGISGNGNGLTLTPSTAGSGVALAVNSGGTDESLTVNAKGAGTITLQSGQAPVAGGDPKAALLCTSTANLGIYFGTGSPSFSAAKGSLYIKTDAATSATRLYIATDSAGTWAAFTAAA